MFHYNGLEMDVQPYLLVYIQQQRLRLHNKYLNLSFQVLYLPLRLLSRLQQFCHLT